MNIRNRTELKHLAAQRSAASQEGKKILLLFAGLTLGMALLVTAANYVLNLQIGNTGGLGNMGTRAVLDTATRVLPVIQTILAMCLELGYVAAMLRIARGQYVSHRTLKLGFDRFGPLLRLILGRDLILLGAGFASIYLGVLLYLLTPLSNSAMALLQPLVSTTTLMPVTLDEAVYNQLIQEMIPCFILCGVLYLALCLPIAYQYRMASYLLIDNPSYGAMRCLRESRILMRGNRMALLRLDLSLWYYHAGIFLASVLAYGDMLLGMAGITLPFSEHVSFFLFYILYLLCQFAVYFFLRNRVEVAYCLAYESLLPEKPQDNGVVLGNIFQM